MSGVPRVATTSLAQGRIGAGADLRYAAFPTTDEQPLMAFKGDNFKDRATAAADARKKLAERFKAMPRPDDPRMQQLMAERKAVADAREARIAERARLKAEEEARLAEEARLRAIEEARAAEEARKRAIEERARQLQLAAEQKAARDARYAARKARKR